MIINVMDADGLTTAAPVLNDSGAQLLPVNFVLTKIIISALIKQNISTVEVYNSQEVQTKPLLSNQNTDKEYISSLFTPFYSPEMQELKQCLLKKYQ